MRKVLFTRHASFTVAPMSTESRIALVVTVTNWLEMASVPFSPCCDTATVPNADTSTRPASTENVVARPVGN
ncbi:MAG: hypothetical protein ACK55Z_20250, partial [bacterium]